MRLRLIIAAMFVATLPACAQTPSTHPYEPITYQHDIREKPPLHIHIVTVDLTDPRVHLAVSRGGPDPDGDGPWQTTLQTVSTIAAREQMAIAVNGDFFISKDVMQLPGQRVPYFTGNWARVCGWAMSDGQLWCAHAAPASLLVDDKGQVIIGRLGGPPPQNTRQFVSGMCLLVHHGKNVAPQDAVAPRTAVGIDRTGKTLILHVVDGRRPNYSAGMTLAEQADELIKLGCDAAIQLDGGGSTTLVLRDPQSNRCQVINRPSDGHQLIIPISVERAVANAFGVKIDPPTTRPVGAVK